MPERDYYKVLGLSRTASADEVKRAYRKLAKKYHPDRNPDDKAAETRFKEVQSAYEVLSDPQKRKAYDQFGHAGPAGQGWRAGPAGPHVYTWKSGGGPDIPVENLEDLFQVFAGGAGIGRGRSGPSSFEELFSGMGGPGRQARRTRPGAAETATDRDIEHPATLTFEQAIHGTTLDLCLTPGGRTGSRETVSIKIPPGVANGQRIRVRGKGNPGRRGTPPGDLYIVCNIQPHPYFRRVGNDIYLELPLSMTEAALGTKVEIPTLAGRTVLRVPPGTPSGTKLRLKNKGVKPPGTKPQGHQYAVVRIIPPKPLSPRQKELLQELRDTGEGSPRENVGW